MVESYNELRAIKGIQVVIRAGELLMDMKFRSAVYYATRRIAMSASKFSDGSLGLKHAV
jgi:hypothetical protein